MGSRGLDRLLDPASIAVVGASDRQGSVGRVLVENASRGYEGSVYSVNPKRDEVLGERCWPDVTALPETVDLAVIATPAPSVPTVLEQCGEAGVPAALVISAGFGEADDRGRELEERIGRIGRDRSIRIMGPNCLGVVVPSRALNFTFLEQRPPEGGLAFISQSGAVGSAILDWAAEARVGVSAFVSVGNMVDVGFAELIDHLGRDERTRAILMYVEAVPAAHEFLRAARARVRETPIFVVKAGRHARSAEAVASHTGSLAGRDAVYGAAFERAGVTRVDNLEDIFGLSETLAKQGLPAGPRLAVVTNAGGPGIIATDEIIDLGGELASLSDETAARLAEHLPGNASTCNPVDVLGDAGADRYEGAVEACLGDEGVDGAVVIYTPQGVGAAGKIAESVAAAAETSDKPIVTTFVGGSRVERGREVLTRRGLPTLETPQQAVRSWLFMHRHVRGRDLAGDVIRDGPAPRREPLLEVLARAFDEDRDVLAEDEAKAFLDAYGVPVSTTRPAWSADEAVQRAREVGTPVVLKVRSPAITHKSDAGAVVLDLDSERSVREAYDEIARNVEDEIGGPLAVTVQPMVGPVDHELLLGAVKDDVFGPALMFGRGGTGVEIIGDTAMALPPLDPELARRLMRKTRIHGLLEGYRGTSAADLDALGRVLVGVSWMVIDFPQIGELDVNPLAISDGGPIALDARVILDTDVAPDAGPMDHALAGGH